MEWFCDLMSNGAEGIQNAVLRWQIDCLTFKGPTLAVHAYTVGVHAYGVKPVLMCRKQLINKENIDTHNGKSVSVCMLMPRRHWQGIWQRCGESNSGKRFWRPLLYH